MSKKLEGKAALVTGGSRGMGAAIAKRLAEDGASVAITYSSSSDQANKVVADIKAAGHKAIAIKADSGKAEEVIAAVQKTVSEFGTIDILVNNAGILTYGPLVDISLDEIDRAIAVNIKGVYVAAQEASRHMGKGGRIINIGSINSDFVPFSGVSVYAMTKGAVLSMTRGLARDLGPRGITVNNIQPGPVDTDMNPADGPIADMLINSIAVGRYGRGEEVAGMVSYLASEEAAYVTGANLKIDGGVTA